MSRYNTGKIEKIKRSLDNQDKNIELVFQYSDFPVTGIRRILVSKQLRYSDRIRQMAGIEELNIIVKDFYR
ncbi:hypothetical protein ACFQRK_23670 [Parapedobacter sp. GCM10030251]|uniref:hypothetical protein n=1 Tax=Parapedobacter sp. GCM10030251 TaxID=3273419 RepID=UPI00360EB7BD